ncbi:IPT/TIG domain-containing protein [Burkholderia sp. AU33545]|uniref:IPT/TIG domain-containing protein n=1 Tax=Burkholderia sp. AU33545 TaxID=2879631 RepID=UPI001CF34D84|nr:IPT/TIG domain-containing protein [Burkholderia sp. AU33545]MCA8205128.1 IPT/TIG domain-containing protein [Burkholderia sp. AU33545]
MLRRSFRFARTAQVATVLALLSASVSSLASTYNLSYDELGRLVGVVDDGGNTAAYNYDALGNIVSIWRGNSAVSIVAFSPGSGPAGANVTISGAGFSTTASQNTVAFNGTTATIVSATLNQLVVTVPAGATTGPISVTSPAGSATSTNSFSVVSGQAPTITSFTPTIGGAGTTVSITGANFRATTIDDNVVLNTRVTKVSSATTTTIGTTVPPFSTSGHFGITTPYGQATSSQDFFVPPGTHVVADVAVTGRMAMGSSQSVTLSTANQIGMILFDGTAGQRATLLITSSSFGSCSTGTIQILNIDGTVAGTTNLCNGTLLTPVALPVTASFTIVISPSANTTGSVTFSLISVPPDPTATITPGGPAVTLGTTTVGQNMSLTFSGTAGQRVSLLTTNSNFSGCLWTSVSINGPDGSHLAGTNLCSNSFVGAITLPTTGTYTIAAYPNAGSTGSATFQLYDVPSDPTATITPGGPPVTLGTTVPGQNMSLTFNGTAGHRVSLLTTNSNFPGCLWTSVSINGPDGSHLAGTNLCSNSFAGVVTLPTTGTYTIAAYPNAGSTGSATFQLYDVPSDPTATITPGGSPVTLGTTVPGQNMSLTFSGTAGQRVSLLTTNSNFSGCLWTSVSINGPDGSHLAGTNLCSNSFVGAITLPTTGTYTIAAYPNAGSTGSATFQLYDVPSDPTATITPGGSPVTLGTTVPGQNMSLTFNGTAGHRVSLLTTNSNFPGCLWTSTFINGPDGSHLAGTNLCSNSFVGATTLPTTGTYTIAAYPNAGSTGSATFQLYDVPSDPTATIALGGSPVTLGTTVPGQKMSLTFSGTAGQQVSLVTTNSNFPSCGSGSVQLRAPDGSGMASSNLCSNAATSTVSLSVSGTYAIAITPSGTDTGSATFTLNGQ